MDPNRKPSSPSVGQILWPPPPEELDLSGDTVHVWAANLDLAGKSVDQLTNFLSKDERERAEKFHFTLDRKRFIARRGLLRALIGRYLNLEPDHLQFTTNKYGKPALVGAPSQNSLRFNLSHSKGLALFALTQGREVGVDIEYIKLDIEHRSIAVRFFSEREQVALESLPEKQLLLGFYNCWTRKEAYIKAHGKGLSLAIDQFDVTIRPGETAQLLETRHAPLEQQRWRLKHLEPAAGYIGALAVEGFNWELSCWKLVSW